MKNVKGVLLFVLAVLLLLVPDKVQAGSIYESDFVGFSDDGEAWTTKEELPDFDQSGLPGFWYEPGQADFCTGISSTLRELNTGEHYYKYNKNGVLTVGQWRISWKQPRCIQGADIQAIGESFHGMTLGNRRCQRPYFSGWFAYCADCLEPVRVNIYMSEEAAHSITKIPLGMDYYYLCPNCNHLEQGAEIKHECKKISYNRYVVRYKKGDKLANGYMADSFHMYNNAGVFEGNQVTPQKTLSLNKYTRKGYRFTGWNTKPDGSGVSYEDGTEIFNLTEENYNEDKLTGIVTLYAQWERVSSNLAFDANGGSYTGENPVRREYGTRYDLSQTYSRVTPPAGGTVSFQTNGGGYLSPVTGTCSFVRWDMKTPVYGHINGNNYLFNSGRDTTDTAVAVYARNPITLPLPVKDNASFGGWYEDEALTVLAGYDGEGYIPAGDTVLYARWVELKLYSVENYTDNQGKGAADLSWSQPDREGKTYKLYQSSDGGVTYQQISSVSASTEAETLLSREISFEKDGDGARAQVVVIPSSGFYELGASGAQGGSYQVSPEKKYTGGLGGSISGKFYLTQGEVLTFLVGGQDGTNGGGAGSAFGNGGGMTQVSSDLKGVLLAAGGGGGAGEAGDGQPGGPGTKLVQEGSRGESGMSGGGGGYLGGAAGEYIVHNHTEDCFLKGTDLLYSGYYHTHYPEQCTGNPSAWEAAYEDDGDDYWHVQLQKTMTDIEKYNIIYAEYTSSSAWAEEVLQEKSYVKLSDQDGRELARVSPYQVINDGVFGNGAGIRSLAHDVLAGCTAYESRWGEYGDLASAYTFTDLDCNFQFSYIPTEGDYDEDDTPCFEEKDYMVVLTPVADGERGWVNVMVLSYQSGDGYNYYPGWEEDMKNGCFEPLKVDGNYIIYSNDRGTARYQPEGICSSVIGNFSRSVPGAESYVSDDFSVVCRAAFYKGSREVSQITAESLFVFRGGFCDTSLTVKGDYNLTVCGYREGEVISSKPAYGGSSYVNEEYAAVWDSSGGSVSGNGSAYIRAVSVGLTQAQELKGVKAPDREAPRMIEAESIRKTALEEDLVFVGFAPAEDVGTEYFFYAESYSARTGGLLCTSNVTRNLLKTGVKEYLYKVDTNPSTVLAGGESRMPAEEEPGLTVQLMAYPRYLHLAAVDRAGNISGTVHVELKKDDPQLYWQPYTEQLFLSGQAGDREYENIYPGGEDKTYYVKADGATPFLLSFESYIKGTAREAYQIDYQILDAVLADGTGQRHITRLPHTVPSGQEVQLDSSAFVRQTEENGGTVLQDAMYTGAYRSDQAKRVSFYQAFTLPESLNGQRITVVPAAGAGTGNGTIKYSDWLLDSSHALVLIADGEAPEITGLEALQSVGLIDRTQGSIVLETKAADSLSGLKDFYLRVENQDNYSTATYPADENGVVRLEITKTEAVFAGNFSVTAHAVDNVGNETVQSYYVTEFALETEVERILAPHEPIFKRGESGVLSIAAWGYVDRVEVEFPDFLSEYDRTFDYTASPDYKKEEKIQFMIPLYAPEGEGYEITVRAYKGDKNLEEHPSIQTIKVGGSVLDEIRTRLRG